MAKIKTTETGKSVSAFLKSLNDEVKQKDSLAIIELMKKHTGFEPKIWGPTIIGFGQYHYKYESGHEGDMPLVCFSPRKPALVLYLSGFPERAELSKKFGKYKDKGGRGCIYVKKLADIDIKVLDQMIKKSVAHTKKEFPS